MRKSEDDFVNDGLSEEEIAAVGAMAEEPPKQEAVEEPEPPVTQVEQPVAEQPKQEPKVVDVRALQEARAAERELREQMAKQREDYIRLEERTNTLLKAMEEKKQKPAPTLEEDPIGFYEHQLQQLNAKIEELSQNNTKTAEVTQQTERAKAAISRANVIWAQASQVSPDITEAYNFAVEKTREKMLKGGVPAQEIEQALWWQIADFASRAPEDPQEFAEYIKASARFHGWGYQQAVQPVQPVQQQPISPQELSARQERNMSLSTASGGEPPKQLDAKAIASMSDAEFKKLMATATGRKQIEEIMGA